MMSECNEEKPDEPMDGQNEKELVQTLTLDTLPQEIFLHICSFLSMRFLIDVFSNVCTRFKGFIEDDTTWMIRLFAQFPSRYPLIKGENFCWREACSEREEQTRLWCNHGTNMSMIHMRAAHFASVDVIQMVEEGRYCVSGSRDHSLKLWNLSQLGGTLPFADMAEAQNERAHMGWIWCLAYNDRDHVLHSGAWDSLVKSWDVHNFSAPRGIFKLNSAVLSLGLNDNVIACGCYDRNITCFDVRVGPEPIFREMLHRKAVLCLSIDERHIISGCEGNMLVVYDRVAGKTLKTVEFENSYPLSLSYQYNHLWIGDNRGSLHLIDPTNQEFKLIKTYPSVHSSQVTGIHFSLGSLITCSLDKKLKVHEPNDNPCCLSTISFTSGISGISAYKNILASAHSDDSITIWLPKEN